MGCVCACLGFSRRREPGYQRLDTEPTTGYGNGRSSLQTISVAEFEEEIRGADPANIVHLKGFGWNMNPWEVLGGHMSLGAFALWYLRDCTHLIFDGDNWQEGGFADIVVKWLMSNPTGRVYAFKFGSDIHEPDFQGSWLQFRDHIIPRMTVVVVDKVRAWEQCSTAASSCQSFQEADDQQQNYAVLGHYALQCTHAWRILCIGGGAVVRTEAEMAVAADAEAKDKPVKYSWIVCMVTGTPSGKPNTIEEWAMQRKTKIAAGLELLKDVTRLPQECNSGTILVGVGLRDPSLQHGSDGLSALLAETRSRLQQAQVPWVPVYQEQLQLEISGCRGSERVLPHTALSRLSVHGAHSFHQHSARSEQQYDTESASGRPWWIMKLSEFADAIQTVPRAAIVHLKGSSANIFGCITPKQCMSAGVFALWYLDDCTHVVIDADSWEVCTLIEVVLAWLTLDPQRQAYAFMAAASRRSRQFLEGCTDVPDLVKRRLVIVEIEMAAAWSQFMDASSIAASGQQLDMNEWAHQVCAHCALSATQAWRILCIGGNPSLKVEAEIAAAASTGSARKGAKYNWLICDTAFTMPPRPATIAEWAIRNQCNRLVGLQLLQSSAKESWRAEKDAAVLALGWCHDNAEWCRWSEEWEIGAADIPGTEQCQAATIVPCSESSHLILSCTEGMGGAL